MGEHKEERKKNAHTTNAKGNKYYFTRFIDNFINFSFCSGPIWYKAANLFRNLIDLVDEHRKCQMLVAFGVSFNKWCFRKKKLHFNDYKTKYHLFNGKYSTRTENVSKWKKIQKKNEKIKQENRKIVQNKNQMKICAKRIIIASYVINNFFR